MTKLLRRRVRLRANGRCEYCGIPDAFDVIPFQIDHIIAIQHHGKTGFANLAYACSACNGRKGPNLTGIDPRTRDVAASLIPATRSGTITSAWLAVGSSAEPPQAG